MSISLNAPTVRVVDCGLIADVVTRGSMSVLDAMALWGHDWPEDVEIVTFASGRGKAKAWAFLSTFLANRKHLAGVGR